MRSVCFALAKSTFISMAASTSKSFTSNRRTTKLAHTQWPRQIAHIRSHAHDTSCAKRVFIHMSGCAILFGLRVSGDVGCCSAGSEKDTSKTRKNSKVRGKRIIAKRSFDGEDRSLEIRAMACERGPKPATRRMHGVIIGVFFFNSCLYRFAQRTDM